MVVVRGQWWWGEGGSSTGDERVAPMVEMVVVAPMVAVVFLVL